MIKPPHTCSASPIASNVGLMCMSKFTHKDKIFNLRVGAQMPNKNFECTI